jgi:hypothetical protein
MYHDREEKFGLCHNNFKCAQRSSSLERCRQRGVCECGARRNNVTAKRDRST